MAGPWEKYAAAPAASGPWTKYAQQSAPAQPESPPVTAMDRAGAGASGINRGVVHGLGLPVDTAANVRDLGKAIVGPVVAMLTSDDGYVPLRPDGRPVFYDIDEDGNPVPGRVGASGGRIPEWLQLTDRSQEFGTGAYLERKVNEASAAAGVSSPLEIPRPDDAVSRFLHAAGAALPMAVVGARTAPPIKNAPDPGMRLPTHIGANVAGAEASQLTAELGGDQNAQMLAGALTGGAVAGTRAAVADTTKRSFRGGEEGRQRTAQTIQDFEDAGTFPSAGQATQTRRARATESLVSKVPGGAGRMATKAEQQARELGTMVEKMATSLAPKASGEQAGRAITRGVSGEGGFVEQFKKQQTKLYDELDSHIKQDARVDVANTAAALEKLNADIPGAPHISEFFKNAKIRGIEGALKADTEGAAALAARQDIPEFSGATASRRQPGTPEDPFRQTPNRDPFGPATREDLDLAASLLNDKKLPYEALKKLRTLVGNEMADSGPLSDVPRSKWKALYAALSQDMEAAATAAGPKATAAFNRANNYTRAGMRRIEVLDGVVDKNGGPEAVFRAATSGTKEGATTLRAVLQSLSPHAQKLLSASVLRRLGRATAGRQDDLGETFSTETFLTNWNTLSPQARAVLFDRFGAGFRSDMDTLAKVASNLRQGSKVFQNPSGTGPAAAQIGAGVGIATAAATGNFGLAALGTLGIVHANLAARLMTNPRFVRWLAKSTQASPKVGPALLIQLEQGSEDEREFARLLKESQQRAR